MAKDLNAIRELSRLASLRADATALRLLTFLLGHPVVSVKQVASAREISFVAANRPIEQLVERAFLSEPKTHRNREFHASEVLARLGRECGSALRERGASNSV